LIPTLTRLMASSMQCAYVGGAGNWQV
jgi:hypothetical protein